MMRNTSQVKVSGPSAETDPQHLQPDHRRNDEEDDVESVEGTLQDLRLVLRHVSVVVGSQLGVFDLGHGSLSSMRTTGWGLAGRCAPVGTSSTLEPVAKNVGAVPHS